MTTRAWTLRWALVLFVVAAAGAAQAAPVDMNPGEWEITTTASMPGMGEMPPQTHKTCLTQESLVPKPQSSGEQCKITELKTKGNTVTWEIACSDPGGGMSGTGAGSMTYSGDSFSGTTQMSIEMPGQAPMTMEAKMSGKRVGECPK